MPTWISIPYRPSVTLASVWVFPLAVTKTGWPAPAVSRTSSWRSPSRRAISRPSCERIRLARVGRRRGQLAGRHARRARGRGGARPLRPGPETTRASTSPRSWAWSSQQSSERRLAVGQRRERLPGGDDPPRPDLAGGPVEPDEPPRLGRGRPLVDDRQPRRRQGVVARPSRRPGSPGPGPGLRVPRAVDLAGREVEGPAVGPPPGDDGVASPASRTRATRRRRSGRGRGPGPSSSRSRSASPPATCRPGRRPRSRRPRRGPRRPAPGPRRRPSPGAGPRRAVPSSFQAWSIPRWVQSRSHRPAWSKSNRGRSIRWTTPNRNGNGTGSTSPRQPRGSRPRAGRLRRPGAGGVKSTRKSPTLTGDPRRHSRNWTWPGSSIATEKTRVPAAARRVAGGEVGLRHAPGVAQDHHVPTPRRPGPRAPAPAPGPGWARGRSPPRAGPAPRRRAGAGRTAGPACRSSRPAGPDLPPGRQPAERQGRGGQGVADPAPGPDPLVEQEDQLLGHGGVRLLAVEVEQLVLGEPAEELDVVDGELAGQDLLGPAPGRHVGIAPGGQGPVGQPPGGQGQGADELRHHRHGAGQPLAGRERGEDPFQRPRLERQDRLGHPLAGVGQRRPGRAGASRRSPPASSRLRALRNRDLEVERPSAAATLGLAASGAVAEPPDRQLRRQRPVGEPQAELGRVGRVDQPAGPPGRARRRGPRRSGAAGRPPGRPMASESDLSTSSRPGPASGRPGSSGSASLASNRWSR